MRRTILLAAFLVAGCHSQTRFGREILEPDDRSLYGMSRIDELDAPAISIDRLEVGCLAYRDASRLYLELEIRNRTGRDVELGKDFVTADQAGRKLARSRTTAVAREVETEALRPFVPKARDRAAVDEEAQRHLAQQEIGIALASLLQVFAQESGSSVLPSGEDHTIAATFEAPKNDRDPLTVVIRALDREFRFRFAARLKTRS